MRKKNIFFGNDGVKYVRRKIDDVMYPNCIALIVKNPFSFMIRCLMISKGVRTIRVVNLR